MPVSRCISSSREAGAGGLVGANPNKTLAAVAFRQVDRLLKEGYTWVLDADIKSYFDTIPYVLLMNCLREKVSDGRILHLIEIFSTRQYLRT